VEIILEQSLNGAPPVDSRARSPVRQVVDKQEPVVALDEIKETPQGRAVEHA
jgi:hypothetical protein